jgi:hypothetical protein
MMILNSSDSCCMAAFWQSTGPRQGDRNVTLRQDSARFEAARHRCHFLGHAALGYRQGGPGIHARVTSAFYLWHRWGYDDSHRNLAALTVGQLIDLSIPRPEWLPEPNLGRKAVMRSSTSSITSRAPILLVGSEREILAMAILAAAVADRARNEAGTASVVPLVPICVLLKSRQAIRSEMVDADLWLSGARGASPSVDEGNGRPRRHLATGENDPKETVSGESQILPKADLLNTGSPCTHAARDLGRTSRSMVSPDSTAVKERS